MPTACKQNALNIASIQNYHTHQRVENLWIKIEDWMNYMAQILDINKFKFRLNFYWQIKNYYIPTYTEHNMLDIFYEY